MRALRDRARRTTCSPSSSRSRSRVRGPLRSARTRPCRASIASSCVEQLGGASAVSSTATALTKSGWSGLAHRRGPIERGVSQTDCVPRQPRQAPRSPAAPGAPDLPDCCRARRRQAGRTEAAASSAVSTASSCCGASRVHAASEEHQRLSFGTSVRTPDRPWPPHRRLCCAGGAGACACRRRDRAAACASAPLRRRP